MPDPTPESDLSAEFSKLGHNLKSVLKTAWESDERQRLQRELETGLTAVGAALREVTTEFTEGEAGQKIKAEAKDFSERIHTGQVENQLRQDLFNALRTLNAEIEKHATKSDKADA